MPSVWADNEEVTFNEGVPTDPKQIYELLMGALSEQRRSVVEFAIDGVDALKAGVFPDHFEKIQAFSMLHDEITLRLSSENLKLIEKLDIEIDAYSRNILSTPWSEVFKRMDHLIERIQPFADLVDNVAPFANAYSPPWASNLNELAKQQGVILTDVLKSFEEGNPANLSDIMTIDLLPLVKRTQKLFSSEILPQLENSVENLRESTESKHA